MMSRPRDVLSAHLAQGLRNIVTVTCAARVVRLLLVFLVLMLDD